MTWSTPYDFLDFANGKGLAIEVIDDWAKKRKLLWGNDQSFIEVVCETENELIVRNLFLYIEYISHVEIKFYPEIGYGLNFYFFNKKMGVYISEPQYQIECEQIRWNLRTERYSTDNYANQFVIEFAGAMDCMGVKLS